MSSRVEDVGTESSFVVVFLTRPWWTRQMWRSMSCHSTLHCSLGHELMNFARNKELQQILSKLGFTANTDSKVQMWDIVCLINPVGRKMPSFNRVI